MPVEAAAAEADIVEKTIDQIPTIIIPEEAAAVNPIEATLMGEKPIDEIPTIMEPEAALEPLTVMTHTMSAEPPRQKIMTPAGTRSPMKLVKARSVSSRSPRRVTPRKSLPLVISPRPAVESGNLMTMPEPQ